MDHTALFAFSLTLIAGLSTGIGSLIATFAKRANTKFLSISLGFSAGVMLYVSFMEIIPKSQDILSEAMGGKLGVLVAMISFFSGMALIAIIDKLLPISKSHHERPIVYKDGKIPEKAEPNKEEKLLRMGLFTALAIAIHNFPEGIATFLSALQHPALGLSITMAIAIHNIPEGISVYIPIYYATGKKKMAFAYSFLSGLAEPIGALLGYFLLRPYLSGALFGIIFACVAGIMVFISLDELLPTAHDYGEPDLSILGVVGGMIIMALSLYLFM